MATLTRYYVSDDISLLVYDHGLGLQIHSRHEVVSVAPDELPALIARLEEAAQGMGVSAGQAELAKALRGLLWVIEAMRNGKPLAPGYQERVEAAKQALAKVQK